MIKDILRYFILYEDKTFIRSRKKNSCQFRKAPLAINFSSVPIIVGYPHHHNYDNLGAFLLCIIILIRNIAARDLQIIDHPVQILATSAPGISAAFSRAARVVMLGWKKLVTFPVRHFNRVCTKLESISSGAIVLVDLSVLLLYFCSAVSAEDEAYRWCVDKAPPWGQACHLRDFAAIIFILIKLSPINVLVHDVLQWASIIQAPYTCIRVQYIEGTFFSRFTSRLVDNLFRSAAWGKIISMNIYMFFSRACFHIEPVVYIKRNFSST